MGVIDGAEWLCLLCPERRIPTIGVTAWAWCGHCGEPLTRLEPVQQEPRYYNVNLLSGLCTLQPQEIRKAGEGQRSPTRGGEVLGPSVPSVKIKDICVEEEASATCGLARVLVTACASVQKPDDIPEEPARSRSLAVPLRKEPMLEGGMPPGELDEVSEGRVMDWGSPRILEKFGSLDVLFGHLLGRVLKRRSGRQEVPIPQRPSQKMLSLQYGPLSLAANIV